MEGPASRERYHEPRTLYTFALSSPAETKPTLVLASGRHASAFVLSQVTAAPVTLKVTAAKGEQQSTWDCATLYMTADHWVAVMALKSCDEFAYHMLEFLFATLSPARALALDSILESDYVGEPGKGVKYLSNPQGKALVQETMAPGNVLRGVGAACVLLGEVKNLPCAVVLILTSDHVLSSSTCRLYETSPLLSTLVTSPGSYTKGISAVERSVYSHNIYS